MSPHMVNQINLQLNASFPITHLMMNFGKLCKHCRSSMLRRNNFTLKLEPLVMDFIRALILYDHVMHDHTRSHHVPNCLVLPSSSRIPKDALSRLKNTKCTLHILPSTLLSLGKSLPLMSAGLGIFFTRVVH